MKKEYIILAAIIVVLSAYLVLHREGTAPVDLPVLEDLSQVDLSKIEIAKAGKTITLERQDGAWVVGADKFPADENQVKAMVTHIKDLKITALVSEAENYARYDLDDEHKIKVTAYGNGKVLRTFDVGKAASSYRHTFVRMDKDKRVFHAEENFRDALDKSDDGLTDKKVLACDPEKITGIKADMDKTSYGFERKKEAVPVASAEKQDGEKKAPQTLDLWADASGKEMDKTKITDFIMLFSNLNCDRYIKGSKKEDFKDPLLHVSLSGDKTLSLSIFNKPDDQEGFPAVSSETPFPFTLSAEKVEEIKGKLKGI